VDGANIGTTRTQGREIDADTTTTRHNFGHHLQVVKDTLAAVLRARYNKTIIICYRVPGSRSCENSAAGHELKVGQGVVKFLFPFRSCLRGLLDFGDAARHARPELLRVQFQRVPRSILEGVTINKYFLA